MGKSIESDIRLKAVLICVVVVSVCCGVVLYLYGLRRNIDSQKEHLEHYNKALTFTTELMSSVNQAQSEANLYITSKNTSHLRLFRQKTTHVEELIDSLKKVTLLDSREGMLNDIGVLLRKKGHVISELNKQFNYQSPIDSIHEKLQNLDTLHMESPVLVTAVVRDTVLRSTSQKGFWKRLSDVFSPDQPVDTVFRVSTLQKDTVKLASDEKKEMLSEISVAAGQASEYYTAQLTTIQELVNRLIRTDQDLSLQISSLLNELFYQTMDSTLYEVRKSERQARSYHTFSIWGGGLSLLLILVFIWLIINDVNKGQAARRRLEQANEQIRKVMESRHQLLLSVSHDIKTPLNSILGYLELWQKDPSVPSQDLLSMQNSGKHILSLLDNLLRFSGLEQGTLTPAYDLFNLRKVCMETSGMFMPLARQKKLSFDCEFLFDKEIEVKSDVLMIKQIVINILSNSVKYTSVGGVLFRVSHTENNLCFYIRDTGAGIPPDQMDLLFRPFRRVEQNNALASGNGLGMYVVKGLVDLLKGEITVKSTVNEGTVIEIIIPAGIFTEEQSRGFTSQRILVIDDDPVLLKVLEDMLVKLGHKVFVCHNLNEFEQLNDPDGYDMVITDMDMGLLSGTDVLKKVRETGREIRVVVMTGQSDYDKTKALAAGFDDYLPKPVTLDSLSCLTGGLCHADGRIGSLEEMFDGDRVAITEILAVFVRSTKEHIVLLQEAIREDDFRKVQFLCHKMLPMFIQVGATEAAEILKRVDSSRSEGVCELPHWKERITELIGKAENLMVEIGHHYSVY